MEEKMIEKINMEIGFAVYYFNTFKKNDHRRIAKIHGMIEMLEIATGKKYSFDKNGVYEVK